MNKLGGRWGYSGNEENYHGDFDTREEAIQEAIACGCTDFVTAQYKDFEIQVDADTVLDQLRCEANDFAGEVADDWALHVDAKDAGELTDSLTNVVIGWMHKHGYEPSFAGIDESTIQKYVAIGDVKETAIANEEVVQ